MNPHRMQRIKPRERWARVSGQRLREVDALLAERAKHPDATEQPDAEHIEENDDDE